MNKQTTLKDWYETHGRKDLPWRTTTDPYAIYISEIMLQQTQVKTILDRFYHPFLKRFPTLQSLADAPEQDVLKAWEGMGYYSRARNLHHAAKKAAPSLPKTVEELITLPGIGRNTAHAVAAFAYRQPVAIMEANVKRVLHRLHAKETMPVESLWQAADALLDRSDPFTHNQAMMDIGAMICTPKAPRCPECPLESRCEGKFQPERFPLRIKKTAVPVRKKILLVAEDSAGKLFLESRSEKLLGGLYGFPQLEPAARLEWQGKPYALSSLLHLGSITHTYSHFRLEGEVYLLKMGGHRNAPEWHTIEEIQARPLSKADHKVLALFRQRQVQQKPADNRRSERA